MKRDSVLMESLFIQDALLTFFDQSSFFGTK